ncbi:hypothetical protein ACS0TY_021209 [Phlomoides rotata]
MAENGDVTVQDGSDSPNKLSRIMNISDPAIEEPLQKKILIIDEAETSSSPSTTKIKIEDVVEEKKTGKGNKNKGYI